MRTERTRVLYIGGAGRSGSTLLERVAASADNVFAAGEMRWIWDRGLRDNQLCSCGVPFRDCPFWTAVFDASFGGIDQLNLDAILDARGRLDRLRYIPMLANPSIRLPDFRSRLADYSSTIGSLYDGIRRVSGASVIIDSSKDPPYGFLLWANPSIELNLIHLVRDSRAVVYSWRRKRVRPEIHQHRAYMDRFSPSESSRLWMRSNVLTELLGRRVSKALFLKYEDYVQRPEICHEWLREGVGLNFPPNLTEAAPTSNLANYHSVAGNPIRLQPGPIKFRLDREWEEDIGRRDFLVATLMTSPLLFHYGYQLFPKVRESHG